MRDRTFKLINTHQVPKLFLWYLLYLGVNHAIKLSTWDMLLQGQQRCCMRKSVTPKINGLFSTLLWRFGDHTINHALKASGFHCFLIKAFSKDSKDKDLFTHSHKTCCSTEGIHFCHTQKTWYSITKKLNKVSDTDYKMGHYPVQGRKYYAVWWQQSIPN